MNISSVDFCFFFFLVLPIIVLFSHIGWSLPLKHIHFPWLSLSANVLLFMSLAPVLVEFYFFGSTPQGHCFVSFPSDVLQTGDGNHCCPVDVSLILKVLCNWRTRTFPSKRKKVAFTSSFGNNSLWVCDSILLKIYINNLNIDVTAS